ncbi:hypothetical protein [Streptomyces sp. NBC_01615]|uniref:hypothetical protein n=1 Tax=Streptomyces sp. NBC_01615 TaxID=2975898 RepID=UPI00386BCA88
MGAVDKQLAVVEVQAPHHLGQAGHELVADRAHLQARPAPAGPASGLDADQGGLVDGRGRSEGQAQTLVDRRADGVGLGGYAERPVLWCQRSGWSAPV